MGHSSYIADIFRTLPVYSRTIVRFSHNVVECPDGLLGIDRRPLLFNPADNAWFREGVAGLEFRFFLGLAVVSDLIAPSWQRQSRDLGYLLMDVVDSSEYLRIFARVACLNLGTCKGLPEDIIVEQLVPNRLCPGK